jgi:hypothetical protein
MTPRGRLLLLLLNLVPLAHVVLLVGLVIVPSASWPVRAAALLTGLYLLPPLATRVTLAMLGIREGSIPFGSRDFFVWWFSMQWQVVFCRFPALEEVLRMVPGLYSAWLRLWGARIGRLTYWAPGTLILDRSFLSIGDDVVFGAGVRLNAHVIVREESGESNLLLATIRIGERALIGGYSLLTAGTVITPGETTRAFLISPPFSTWRGGKRVRTITHTHEELENEHTLSY